MVGFPQVNAILFYKGPRAATNYSKLDVIKKRYETAFNYHKETKKAVEQVVSKKLKGIYLDIGSETVNLYMLDFDPK